MNLPCLDELDQRLLAALAEDARVSNRRISTQLGVTEGTVRGRLKRLQQEGLIAFTAITSFDVSQTSQMAFVRLQVDPTKLRDVAEVAARILNVDAVTIALGRFNLILICLINDIAALHDITSNQLAPLTGVHRIVTSIAVSTLKYDPSIVKIIPNALGSKAFARSHLSDGEASTRRPALGPPIMLEPIATKSQVELSEIDRQ